MVFPSMYAASPVPGGGGLATCAANASLDVVVVVVDEEVGALNTHGAPTSAGTLSTCVAKGPRHGSITSEAAAATSAVEGDVPDRPATSTPGAYTARHEKL